MCVCVSVCVYFSGFCVCALFSVLLVSYLPNILLKYSKILIQFLSYLAGFFKYSKENLLNSPKIWIQKMSGHPDNAMIGLGFF